MIYDTITLHEEWFNTPWPLLPNELKNRIILLDFWTFCCINCMHVLPDLAFLEEKFGNQLTVIGVHSAKFDNERDGENIRSAIIRYGIAHPVTNDADFSIWQRFGVRAWPTLILITPKGQVFRVYSGEGHRRALEQDIQGLIDTYQDILVQEPLPVALEKDRAIPGLLRFPAKIKPMSYVGQEALAISDNGHNQIRIISLSGNTLEIIGSGAIGKEEGEYSRASFNSPQGILYDPVRNGIYVADTGNHLIRFIDMQARWVYTVAGTGKQGYTRLIKKEKATEVSLSSPWDIAFYPDSDSLVIAMAGLHQLWQYHIVKNTLSVVAGNGRESIEDGEFPVNSLSQPSGLSVWDRKLYFVDSETSSLRVMQDKTITTLVGTGLFDFGYRDGPARQARLQHAIGVYADESGIAIADSYNHSIRYYDPEQQEVSTLFDGREGHSTGLQSGGLNEPNDVVRIGNSFYIADTNNHLIKKLSQGKLSTLVIIPPPEERKALVYRLSSALPNKQALPPLSLRSPASFCLLLAEGWKISHQAPSYVALFSQETGAVVISWENEALLQQSAPFSLSEGDYILQGVIYYCREMPHSVCYIQSVEEKVTISPSGADILEISLNTSMQA